MKTSEKKYASVLELNGVPRFKEAFPLALQHVVAMVVGCITPAILVANTTQMSQEDKTLLIQAALVIAAIATALQLFPIFGRIGAGLPIIMGVRLPKKMPLASTEIRSRMPTGELGSSQTAIA